MKGEKTTGGQRLLALLLIAVILVLALGFAANGLQDNETPKDEPPTETDDKNEQNKEENTENNENKDDENADEIIPSPPVTEENIQYNQVTGLRVTNDESVSPLGFVLHSSMPLYGISNSDLTIEFPTENGSTRLLTYTTNDALLWKVGSLAPSRSFINGMSVFFGGTIIAYGNDDIVKYSAGDGDKSTVDASKFDDCYYIENIRFVYTSKDMANELIRRNGLLNSNGYIGAPYSFLSEESSFIGETAATEITLPYSENSRTVFHYSESSGEYLYFKDGKRKVDMLNGKNISFRNVFILFANTTTYERSEGTEMVIDTTSGGKGYYISGGTKTEITWSTTLDGKLEFKTLSGEILEINRGKCYIGYYKSSQTTSVLFS